MALKPLPFNSAPIAPVARKPIAFGSAPIAPQQEQAPSNSPITQGDTTNDGFLTSLIKDPLKTLIVKPALRTAQAAAGLIGVATGNETLKNNAQNDVTFDVPVLGKYLIEGLKPIGQGGASQIAGEALNTASYLLPAGRAEKAGASLFKGQVLMSGGSGALAGAQFGALGGAGSELQNPEHTLGSVLENTLIGGGAGAVGGATLGLAGGVASKAVRAGTKFVQDIRTPEGIYNKLGDTNAGILNLTKNQINNETKFAKDTPLFIAKEAPDVSWNVSKDGRLETQPIIDALQPKYAAEAQAFNNALKDSGEYTNLDSWQKTVENRIKNQFKGTAQESALSKFDAEVLAYKKQYAPNIITHNGESIVPIHIFDDIKSDAWSKSFSKETDSAIDTLAAKTSYLMGNTAKDIIENTVKDSPIKAWNKRLGDFASAIKILNQRNGTKVGPGAFSRTGARILGGIVGHTVGSVPGEIAGMVTADQLVKMAADPNMKSYVFKKLLQRMEKNGQSNIIQEAQNVMNQRAAERQSRKLLPAGGTPNAKIELPSPGILEGQQKLRQDNLSQTSQPTINATRNSNVSTPKTIPTNEGKIKGPGGYVKKIPADDKRVMKDFTDYIGGGMGKMTDKEIKDLELAADRIAFKYGIKDMKTKKGLANEFGRILDDQGLSVGKIAGNPLIGGALLTGAAAIAAKSIKKK